MREAKWPGRRDRAIRWTTIGQERAEQTTAYCTALIMSTINRYMATYGFVVVRRVVVRVLDVTTGLTGTMVVALESVRTTAPVEST